MLIYKTLHFRDFAPVGKSLLATKHPAALEQTFFEMQPPILPWPVSFWYCTLIVATPQVCDGLHFCFSTGNKLSSLIVDLIPRLQTSRPSKVNISKILPSTAYWNLDLNLCHLEKICYYMLYVMLFSLFLPSNIILKNLVLHLDKLRSLKCFMFLLLRLYNSIIRISEQIFHKNWEEELFYLEKLHCFLSSSVYHLSTLSILIFSQEGKNSYFTK